MTEHRTPDKQAIARLNREFYDTTPWVYFEQRLLHLVLAASDQERYRTIFAAGVDLGPLHVDFHAPGDDEGYPSREQSFTAIESEVLLHHAAETLMRFLHAHVESDSCPWLEMSRLRSPNKFKQWVGRSITDAPRQDVGALCASVFACDPSRSDDLEGYVEHVRLLGRHFLDSAPYNAAKHGMAVRGGSERREIEIDGVEIFRREGASVSWLEERSYDGEQAWTLASRLFSPEAMVGLILVSTELMRSLWIRGRAKYLGEPVERVYRAPSPHQLFEGLGLVDHVLANWYEPLGVGGKKTIVVRSAHFSVPQEAADSTVRERGRNEEPEEL